MSFAKADQLLELATMIRARRAGITLADCEERFGCSRRTAQRMMRNVELRFPDIDTFFDEEGCKRWTMRSGPLRELLSLAADELAALDLAVAQLDRDGQLREARLLGRLREKMLALVPSAKASRLETDHDALLEAQGFAARPGPRPRVDEAVAQAVAEAIKACLVVEIDYQSRSDAKPRRRAVMPLGLLTGARRYLVARPEDTPEGTVRTYRLDAVSNAILTERPFARPEDFDLQAFANRAFGLYQSETEYGEVVWRFAPRAAAQARGYLFHPDQTTQDEPDGSLTVRFFASGHLEMAWHLYAWGDAVEVVKPKALRKLVEGYRRSDFGVLP
ncbi:WYL domain-containing protein [uncultured Alsobacter sp.]|uniref:helix-turn-helix transcriptional regulator n=1 Tax=uncultured Alsobacter sp. TaxID=1748258 RepID=UPI0025D9D2F0|nr:WYL domain-containing protein [uncultured Alsobacter sp.]